MARIKKIKFLLLLAGIFSFTVFLDIVTKILAQKYLTQRIKLLPFFHLQYVTNTGAAFGIFQGGQLWLGILSLVVFITLIAIIIHGLHEKSLNVYEIVLLTFLEAGIFGNMLDRLFRGYVIDFFMLPHWPVFNIADIAITLSISLYIIFEVCKIIKKKLLENS